MRPSAVFRRPCWGTPSRPPTPPRSLPSASLCRTKRPSTDRLVGRLGVLIRVPPLHTPLDRRFGLPQTGHDLQDALRRLGKAARRPARQTTWRAADSIDRAAGQQSSTASGGMAIGAVEAVLLHLNVANTVTIRRGPVATTRVGLTVGQIIADVRYPLFSARLERLREHRHPVGGPDPERRTPSPRAGNGLPWRPTTGRGPGPLDRRPNEMQWLDLTDVPNARTLNAFHYRKAAKCAARGSAWSRPDDPFPTV